MPSLISGLWEAWTKIMWSYLTYKRDWYSGCAEAFQAFEASSILASRSNYDTRQE